VGSGVCGFALGFRRRIDGEFIRGRLMQSALLHNVSQFVGQQASTFACGRAITAGAEHDV
jgi:hypothetical protein